MDDSLQPMTYGEMSAGPKHVSYRAELGRHLGRLKSFHIPDFGLVRTLWQDLRAVASLVKATWKNLLLHSAFFLILVLALMSSGWSVFLTEVQGSGSYCVPGGDFSFYGDYNPWAIEHLFQITIGFGTMSFTQVKVIDVIWDVIVGRGGQALLALVAYIVFAKCLNRILEQPGATVSYNTFRAIVFESPSLYSLSKLTTGLWMRRNWRIHLSMLWFILASIYITIWPTLTSAMTGYSSNVIPYFNTTAGKQLVNETFFQRIIYKINDANRIEGLSLDMLYLVGKDGFGYIHDHSDPDRDYLLCLESFLDNKESSSSTCQITKGVSQYIDAYGTGGATNANTSIQWLNQTYGIQAPSLNIESFNTSSMHQEFALQFSTGLNTSFDLTEPMYSVSGGFEVYKLSDIEAGGSCDNQSTYMWGFSFLLLFICLVLTGVWSLGMYAMWNDAFWNSRLDRASRQIGFYRGVADVSNAMWKDMMREPGELASESRIEEMLADRKNGGRMAYEEINRETLPLSRSAEILRWTKSVSSLSGWTGPWRPIHWFWFLFMIVMGCIGFYPLVMIGCLFWILALVMGYAGLTGALKRRSVRRREHTSQSYRNHVEISQTDDASDYIELVPETARKISTSI